MMVLAVAALFALVFTRALIVYIRLRDRLQGAVALVFTAVAALFVVQVVRETFGVLPQPVRIASLVLLLGQPFFTLGLVALIRPLPRWVVVVTMIGWVLSAAAIVMNPSPMPRPVVYFITGYFVLAELVSAGYLFVEARRQTGGRRARLGAAAGGTALFAVALFTAGAGGALGSRLVALGSAVAYVLAFMPPRWLRRLWTAQAAYNLMSRLVGAPPDATPREVWQHYADVAAATGAAEAFVVVSSGGSSEDVREPRVIATAGRVAAAGTVTRDAVARGGATMDATGLDDVVRRAFAPDAHVPQGRPGTGELALGGYFGTVIPLTLHAGDSGALLALARHRSLFTEDDVALLSELGRQATVLADRAVLTARLTGMVDALRAANEAKSDFVAAMSHELRTPLNAIIGFSELMGFEDEADGRRSVPADWIENVHSSGRHLLGLINDVLDLAKVESGRLDLRLETLDIGSAVAEAAAPLSALVNAKRLRLTIEVPPVLVQADRLRLRQMLNNLLSNAIKFTPAGGGIHVAAHRTGALAHLSVADTGPGIDPADQELVFEEFHQSGDVQSRAAGTGLGLALTRRLAEAHGGRVELWSQPGQGSRFTLVLPAAESEPAPRPPGDGAGPAGAATGGVLLIEDDTAAASLLQTYLAGAGYAVHVAGTGEEGIALVHRYAPDVILLDVLLPGMDGWAVLQRLKGDERLRHIPVVVVTVVDEREVGLALGAVDYFVKPVERNALLAWLARHGLLPPVERRPRVLAVDPNPTTLAVVERRLIQEGLTVVSATSAAQALELARGQRFDLVMCDLLLPDVDGLTFLGALHDEPACRDVPVLVLTDTDLPEADRARLSDRILGVVSREDLEPARLRAWLARAIHPIAPAGKPGRARVTA